MNQFRRLHFFQPRYRELMDANVHDVVAALLDAGALVVNPLRDAPAEVTGGFREGDERHDAVTAQSPGGGSSNRANSRGNRRSRSSTRDRCRWTADRRCDHSRSPARRWCAH